MALPAFRIKTRERLPFCSRNHLPCSSYSQYKRKKPWLILLSLCSQWDVFQARRQCSLIIILAAKWGFPQCVLLSSRTILSIKLDTFRKRAVEMLRTLEGLFFFPTSLCLMVLWSSCCCCYQHKYKYWIWTSISSDYFSAAFLRVFQSKQIPWERAYLTSWFPLHSRVWSSGSGVICNGFPCLLKPC